MLRIWYPPKRLSNSCRGPPPTQRRAPGRTAEPDRLRVRRCRDGRHRQMAPLSCAGPVFQCRRSSTCSSTFQRPILTRIVRRTDSTIETAIIMRHPKPPPSGRTLTGLTAQPRVLSTRLRQSPLRPFHSAASVGARSGSTAGSSPGSGAGALSGLGSLAGVMSGSVPSGVSVMMTAYPSPSGAHNVAPGPQIQSLLEPYPFASRR